MKIIFKYTKGETEEDIGYDFNKNLPSEEVLEAIRGQLGYPKLSSESDDIEVKRTQTNKDDWQGKH